MEIKLAMFLGLLQGSLFIPLTLYLGLLVRRDLSQRRAVPVVIVNIVAPLAMMIIWLVMSYLAADSLLDGIAGSTDERLQMGKTWVFYSFLGLVAIAVISIVLSRMKVFRR